MVEKWLLQVENLMLRSVRHIIHQGVIQYTEVLTGDLTYLTLITVDVDNDIVFFFIKPAISSL